VAWYDAEQAVADWDAPVSGASIARFRLGSIPVRIEFPFFLVAVLLGVNARPGMLLVWWVAVVFISILVHELGHAVVARRFGQQPRIVLHAFGGLTYSGNLRTSAQDIAVSAAGSLTQMLLLGLPALLLLRSGAIESYTTYVIVHDVQWVSLGWAIINLLPILPLDGGNIAHTLLRKVRRIDALWIARNISVGAALGLAVWAYHTLGWMSALWALFFGILNAVALARMPQARR
jgi:Zn-dependent protease